MSLFDTYRDGAEILGISAGSFVPWLNLVGNVAGGIVGKAAVAKPTATPSTVGTPAAPVQPYIPGVQPATATQPQVPQQPAQPIQPQIQPQPQQMQQPQMQPQQQMSLDVASQVQKALNDDKAKRDKERSKNIRTGVMVLGAGTIVLLLYKVMTAAKTVPSAKVK